MNFTADSGATAHFHQMTNQLHHRPISDSNPAVHVIVPNSNIMTSTATTNLPLPHIKAATTKLHAFPKLATGSLLSLGQICDNACTAIFNSTSVHMYQDQDVMILPFQPPIISGPRKVPFKPWWFNNSHANLDGSYISVTKMCSCIWKQIHPPSYLLYRQKKIKVSPDQNGHNTLSFQRMKETFDSISHSF
jgi:hypothetical protein